MRDMYYESFMCLRVHAAFSLPFSFSLSFFLTRLVGVYILKALLWQLSARTLIRASYIHLPVICENDVKERTRTDSGKTISHTFIQRKLEVSSSLSFLRFLIDFFSTEREIDFSKSKFNRSLNIFRNC